MTDQPASTAPLAAGLPLVQGQCPACGGSSLFLGDGGYVTCSRIDCPEPDAASTVLERPAPTALRDRYAAAIASYDHAVGHATDPAPGDHHHGQADAVMAVRDRELEQLRAQVARVRELAERWRYTSDRKGGPLTELRAALDPQEQS